jgi:hypothetical protein
MCGFCRSFDDITGDAVRTTLVAELKGVKIAQVGEGIQYCEGMLVTADKDQRGFELVLFGRRPSDNRQAVRCEEVQILVTPPDECLASVFASRVREMLCDHFENHRTADGGDEPDQFDGAAFLCSMNASGGAPSQEEVLACMRKSSAVAAEAGNASEEEEWQRAGRYVAQVWDDNVGFLDGEAMRGIMIPSTLPIAELVRMVGQEV